jgi:hypothetical protein
MTEYMHDDGKGRGAVIPQFFVEAVENTFRTSQEGRPQYDDVEFVRLLIPGDRKSMPVQKVDDEIRHRYPGEYASFKAGIEAPPSGTPLKGWPPITPGQILELQHFHIHTLEHLAGVNDAQLQNLGMGMRSLREQAKTFLDVAANGTGPISRMVGENLKLRDEVERLNGQLAAAQQRIKELEGSHAGAAA